MPKVNCNFEKARNVMFLVYPEDWGKTYGELLEYLDGLAIPCACSPLHDRDKYTQEDVNKWMFRHTDENGQLDDYAKEYGVPLLEQQKKPHVHCIICAPGPQQAGWFYDIMRRFHEITYFERVNSVSGQLRYFAHMDSPLKTRYSELDIHGFGGIDLSALLKTDEVSKLETVLDVLDYVETHNITHYSQLVRWSVSTGDMETLSCVIGRASMFASYFKSGTDERKELAAREKAARETQNACSTEVDF